MKITMLLWILFGLIAGAIAKALYRTKDHDGWVAMLVIGTLGAIAGGGFGQYFIGWEDMNSWNFRSFMMAFGSSILLLAMYHAARGETSPQE